MLEVLDEKLRLTAEEQVPERHWVAVVHGCGTKHFEAGATSGLLASAWPLCRRLVFEQLSRSTEESLEVKNTNELADLDERIGKNEWVTSERGGCWCGDDVGAGLEKTEHASRNSAVVSARSD